MDSPASPQVPLRRHLRERTSVKRRVRGDVRSAGVSLIGLMLAGALLVPAEAATPSVPAESGASMAMRGASAAGTAPAVISSRSAGAEDAATAASPAWAAGTAADVAAGTGADAPTGAVTASGPAFSSGGDTTLVRDAATERLARVLSGLGPALASGETFDSALRASANGGFSGDEVEFYGTGSMVTVPGSMPAPDPDRRAFTILVRVEEGIDIDPEVFTTQVFEILNDPRGWGSIDDVSFARTDDPAEANVTLNLAAPSTTQELCGDLPTGGYTSCGRVGGITINAARWVHNADAFVEAGGSDEEYRRYVINHEVGHLLSHWHEPCPAPGATAPVMLQQTLTLGGCVPNGWPAPDALG